MEVEIPSFVTLMIWIGVSLWDDLLVRVSISNESQGTKLNIVERKISVQQLNT